MKRITTTQYERLTKRGQLEYLTTFKNLHIKTKRILQATYGGTKHKTYHQATLGGILLSYAGRINHNTHTEALTAGRAAKALIQQRAKNWGILPSLKTEN